MSRLVEVSNLAVTVRATLIVTVHAVEVPLHDPDQPMNSELAFEAAVKVTVSPLAPSPLQAEVQLRPGQLTVPPPGPAKTTLRGYVEGSSVTATWRSVVIVKVQGPVPVHGLAHPLKSELPSAAAVRVTEVP